MAFYDRFYDQDGAYDSLDMGFRNYYGRESYRRQQPYYDAGYYAAPGMYRHDGRRRYISEPYLENYRRDYHQGGGYTDGRFGVLPREEVIRRVEPLQWMNDGYHHGGQQGGYHIGRSDYHGGQNYEQSNVLHRQDGYDRNGHHGLGRHHGLRRQEAVELYVPLCCDKCERKLRKHLGYLEGVETITMDQTTKKVVVLGNVDPSNVLHRARLDKPESKFWHDRYR